MRRSLALLACSAALCADALRLPSSQRMSGLVAQSKWAARPQGSRAVTASKGLFALPSGFTLDRSAIPRGCISIFKESNNLVLLLLSVIVLMRVVPRKLKISLPTFSKADLGALLWPVWLQEAIQTVQTPIIRLAVFLKLCVKVILAKTFLLVGSVLGLVTRTLDLNPAEEVDIKDWSVCVLEERESLSGGIIKYRFSLPNPSATVPLYVGQEVR